ncbi:hypothetical protein Tco_0499405 [Tanacetum coccineum]
MVCGICSIIPSPNLRWLKGSHLVKKKYKVTYVVHLLMFGFSEMTTLPIALQGLGVVDGLEGTEREYQGLCLGVLQSVFVHRVVAKIKIEADVPLLGAEVDEPMVDPVIDDIVEPIVGVEEQMVALVMDMEGDLAMLFGDDDDSGDDDSEGPEDDEEVWEVNGEWLMAPVTPPLMPVMPPPSTYEVGGPSTAAAEGQSLTLLAPGVPVPPSVIEDLCTQHFIVYE